MRMRTRYYAMVTTTLAIVLVAAIPVSASAARNVAGSIPGKVGARGPAGDIIDTSDPGLKQLRLDEFKSWIINLPGLARSGYIESVDDAAAKSMTLLWYGSSPLQRSIISEGARRGISVSVEHRKHGVDQIDAAIAAAWTSAGQLRGFKISYIAGVEAGYDGITIVGSYTGASAVTAAAASAGRFAAAITTRTGVPARVTAGDSAFLAVSTRSNDQAPFNAGGYMLSPSSGTTCSTGFAIVVSGGLHTTTARHCWRHDYEARSNSSTKYGDGVRNSSDGGAREMSSSGYYWMFDGAWNNSAGYHKTVTGFGDLSLNDFVCTSGGNSGVHCNIKVDAMRVSLNDGFGTFSTIHGTQQTGGAIAAAAGDSGGPVLVTAGSGRVHAAGMIQAGDQLTSNCGSVHDPTVCGRGVLFSSMRTIVNNIPHASLYTG